MSNGPDSKEKTIIAAAKLLQRHGYHGTALSDVLEMAGSPRGSLYFHFPRGKEEIAEAAIAYSGEQIRQAIEGAAGTSKKPQEFLVRIARAMAANLTASDFTEGCPIGPTAAEAANLSEGIKAASRTAFQAWEDTIRVGLQQLGVDAKAAGIVAGAFLCQLEGALLLSKSYRSLEPLRRSEDVAKLLLEAAAANRP